MHSISPTLSMESSPQMETPLYLVQKKSFERKSFSYSTHIDYALILSQAYQGQSGCTLMRCKSLPANALLKYPD